MTFNQHQQTRNEEICQRYMAGETLKACGDRFGISCMRVKQIVKKAGLWRKRIDAEPRNEFLGVDLSDVDKQALRQEAARRGVSMSLLTSDLIKEMLAMRPTEQR